MKFHFLQDDWNETTGKIKVTANIKGIEQYEIDQDQKAGRGLRINKGHIAGQDIEAKQYIQNCRNNKVELKAGRHDSLPSQALRLILTLVRCR